MVSVILDNLAAGLALKDVAGLYPGLRDEQIAAAMADAADLARERVIFTAA